MYKKSSPQSRSFTVLFAIALVGTYACLLISEHTGTTLDGLAVAAENESPKNENPNYTIVAYPSSTLAATSQIKTSQTNTATSTVSTAGWKTYTNKNFGFSFLYPPAWKIKTAKTANGFTIIPVDPGPKYDNIRIYISPVSFFAIEGLPSSPDTISGQTALNIENSVYAVQHNGTYYTFDGGISAAPRASFQALVHSVQFAN